MLEVMKRTISDERQAESANRILAIRSYMANLPPENLDKQKREREIQKIEMEIWNLTKQITECQHRLLELKKQD